MGLERIRQNLIREEGLKLKPYTCIAGKLTIGVGRNIEDRGITEETAMQMLDEDIEICLAELRANVSNFDQHPASVKETLIDLCYNMLDSLPKEMAALTLWNYPRNPKAMNVYRTDWAEGNPLTFPHYQVLPTWTLNPKP